MRFAQNLRAENLTLRRKTMKEIVFENPHRKKHFAFFKEMNHPHFSIVANVDITALMAFVKQEHISFTAAVLFLVSKTANSIPEFRWRIRGAQVVEHEAVHPSLTVTTKVSDTFSFCYVDYHSSFAAFYKAFDLAKQKMEEEPSFEDPPERDDFLFLSSIPWVSFTGFQHAMSYHPADSIPRMVWGKYFEEGGKLKMPLSVQVHHALMDGRHVGRYFELMQELMDEFRG